MQIFLVNTENILQNYHIYITYTFFCYKYSQKLRYFNYNCNENVNNNLIVPIYTMNKECRMRQP